MAAHVNAGGASALPLALLTQAIPMLSRHELASLTERLIDALDTVDGDPDIEDDNEDCAVDDAGCDDAEQGDVEDDSARRLPAPCYGTDQRSVLHRDRFGTRTIYQHEN